MTLIKGSASQLDLFEDEASRFEDETSRKLIDQLLIDSQTYRTSKDFKELLDFIVKLRNIAPFNAMLLHIQKPELNYAASLQDWKIDFNRTLKVGARPLVILWPFAPVVFVYDVMDTVGDKLPEDVATFTAKGEISERAINAIFLTLSKKKINVVLIDERDGYAGSISRSKPAERNENASEYVLKVNRNHPLPVQFSTVAHEIGHLALGHLGYDKKLSPHSRTQLSDTLEEIEAECVSFLVSGRNEIASKSQTYLANYIGANDTIGDINLYPILKAAGQVEAIMGVAVRTRFEKSK